MHDHQKKQHHSLQYDFVNFSVRSSEFYFEKRHRSNLFVYLPDGVYLKAAKQFIPCTILVHIANTLRSAVIAAAALQNFLLIAKKVIQKFSFSSNKRKNLA